MNYFELFLIAGGMFVIGFWGGALVGRDMFR